MENEMLFGFAKWLCKDTKHANKTAPGSVPELNEEFWRSLMAFARANNLEPPEDFEGVVFPNYDY
jgi:hypothetical protein